LSKSARILVVDDDEGLLVLMAEALRAEGHEVSTAASGEEAWRWLKKKPTDLLLLDLKMRDLAGPALLRRLRHGKSQVPFIVVTGQGDEKVAVEVMKQGALDYVMKDGSMLDLLPTVVKRALSALEAQLALAASRRERLRLENEIQQASEGERRRIGADLHDGLGQQLTAIGLLCSALKQDADAVQPELGRRLGQMAEMLREAIAQTRALAHGLVPVGEDPEALRVGLSELADRAGSVGRLRCRLECPALIELRNPAVAGQLYRIAQEAVNNAMKHSQARELVIRLFRKTGDLRLEISDDGKGLPEARSRGRGIGLGVMKHRAALIGGTLRLITKAGRGTTIACAVPDLP